MRALKYVPKLLESGNKDSELDAEALALLGSTLDEKNARTIQNYTTFKGAFEAIVKMHENKTADEKQSLFERLNSYRITSLNDVNENIGEIMEIVAQLKSMKESISDTNIIGVMSASLPPEFELFKAAWKEMPEEKRTVEEFTARVFAETSELLKKKSTNDSSIALLTRSRSRQGDRSNDTCRYCKNKGHWIQDCKELKEPYDPNYQKRKGKRVQKGNESSNNGDIRGVAFSICIDKVDSNMSHWVADSGCTHHMTPFEQLFVELERSDMEVTR